MPIRYIPFEPQVLQGQALLDNFTRTRRILRYRDNDSVFRTFDRGMPLYETSLVEKIGGKTPDGINEGGKNLVLRGECLSACAYLKDKGIKIDLVYIDPPFASGADYAKKIYLRRNPIVAEALSQVPSLGAEGATLDDEGLRAFEEKMYGDIWNKEQYLNWMYENLMAIKSVMSDNASIYVHLDWHIGHYVKILMDEIFGEENFINEIIWCYSIGGKGDAFFGRKHDNIYLYSKNKESYVFNGSDENVTTERKANSHMRSKVDEDGREYQEKTDKKSGKVYKYYIDEGKIPEDYWIDIEQLNREDSERNDYATQKPSKLLKRIIAASSNKNSVIADFFGGSGVAALAASELGRQFIHADVGINSIQTVRDRLKTQGASFEILEIEDGVSLYRNPAQTMTLLKTKILNLRNEDPLPAFFEGEITDSQYGAIPVYLPNLQDHTTRLLNKYWISRIINEALSELDANRYKRVRLFYIDIDNEKELLGYIKDNNLTGIEIELADLKPLLAEVRLEDDAVCRVEGSNTVDAGNPDASGKGYKVWIDMFKSDRLNERIKAFNDKGLAQNSKLDLTETDEDNEEEAKPKGKKAFKPIEISDNGLELIEMMALDCTNTQGVFTSDVELKIDKNSFVILNGVKSKTYWDGSLASDKKPLRLKIRNIAGDETILDLSESGL